MQLLQTSSDSTGEADARRVASSELLHRVQHLRFVGRGAVRLVPTHYSGDFNFRPPFPAAAAPFVRARPAVFACGVFWALPSMLGARHLYTVYDLTLSHPNGHCDRWCKYLGTLRSNNRFLR